MVAPPVVWRPDERCCATATWPGSWRPSGIDDFPTLRATFDRRARVVLGRGRALPRAAVRHAVRRGCSTRRPASSGRRGSPAAGATRRRCASTRLDADRPAVVWEGEDGTTRTLSGAELRALTDRIAAGLAARGVGSGDAVGLFMPMVPETVAALFAIAKLGAIFLPIFSGYGADAVAIRLQDAAAVAVVTADGFTRRGKLVTMKETADAAVAQVAERAHRVWSSGAAATDTPMQAGSRHPPRRPARRRRSTARVGRQRTSVVRRVHERHDRSARRARCTCTAGSP